MAVSVHIPRVAKEAEHKDALDFQLHDGHLVVTGVGSIRVAVYAPGSWTHAEVTK